MREPSSALYFDDLFYAYPPPAPEITPTPVLRGIRLSVARGETAALLGRTGAGKTTLLLSTVGIVPQRTGGTFRGRVLVHGLDTRYTPVSDLATRVGFLFQDPDAQVFHIRVEDEIAFALENLGLPEREIERRVNWALDVVGLTPMRDRAPAHLSGGEKQRLALAAVLAMRPDILVLDEPTANLDPTGRDDLLTLLASLAAQGHTLFLATQEVDWVTELARTCHALDQGHLLLSGPTESVFAQTETLRQAAVPLPQIVEARLALEHRGLVLPPFYRFDQAVHVLRAALTRAGPKTVDNAALASRPPEEDVQETVSLPQVNAPDVRIRDLAFTYPNGVSALRHVSLDIAGGEFVALVGPNGAGKSTLARHLIGLLRPSAGSVQVGSLNATHEPVHRLARWVGYVFQNPDHQLFAATVEEEIAFAPRNLGLSPPEVEERVRGVMTAFKLHDLARVPPAVLGFGLRRKVALAAVLAAWPPVIILDEPTTGLDAVSAREVMRLITAYHRAGHTIILITHDMRLVAEYAPRTVVLHKGSILFDGSTRALFQRPDVLRAAHLSPPPVARLAQTLAEYGLPSDVLTVDDFARAFLRAFRSRHYGRG